MNLGPFCAPRIIHELKKGYYGFKKLTFSPGDVVIDIGGHIASLYLAQKYPFLQILRA